MERFDIDASGLHARLYEIVGDKTYRAIGELTGQNPETVRRYMTGQAPSIEFLAAICATQGVSADWLITGQGVMRVSEARRRAKSEANPGEVLHAVAGAMEGLAERLDRLEAFVHTLEARLRAAPPDRAIGAAAPPPSDAIPNEREQHEPGQRPHQPQLVPPASRAKGPGFIAGAIPPGPHPRPR